MSGDDDATLVCPACDLRHPPEKKFCDSCGTPLTFMGADVVQGAVSDAHERARKVDPRYTEGELVRVAGGRHQAEAEMIQGMLLEEGVPSILRRSPGFDVPDFLAAGPRDVIVPAGGYEAAREVLLQSDLAPQEGAGTGGMDGPQPLKLTAAIVLGGTVASVAAWALLEFGG